MLESGLFSLQKGWNRSFQTASKEILPKPQLESRADIQSLVASFIQRRITVTAQLADRFLRDPPDPRLPLDILSLELGEVVLADGLSKACRLLSERISIGLS